MILYEIIETKSEFISIEHLIIFFKLTYGIVFPLLSYSSLNLIIKFVPQ